MRIISGNKKSIVINAPKNLPVRPTTDKVKESLFNIIQNKFELNDCRVLDVFSGTGNISYEFGSRGVKLSTVESFLFVWHSFITFNKAVSSANALALLE